MISGKTILISSLDWGLGHATRCVPLIKRLSENNMVLIGVTHLNKNFFEQHFPSLKKIDLPSYNIVYSTWLPVWLKIFMQSPKLRSVIREEEKILRQIVKEHKIDLVISDNRFGLHHKTVESIFITHQLVIKAPFFSGLASRINRQYIHRFHKVWVPDHQDKHARLSGCLSDSEHISIPVEYIGPQSALENIETDPGPEKKYDYLILLSGAEPQRTILEKIVTEKFKDSDKSVLLIRGTKSKSFFATKNITGVNVAYGRELKSLITHGETIICRSGYSTLMDLHILGKKKLVLIPTPGQTEQEYLASYWSEKFGAVTLRQDQVANHNFI